MKIICPECQNKALPLNLLSFKKRVRCEHCNAQFITTSRSMSKWIISFLGSIWFTLAITAGLLLQSWVIFIILLLIAPPIINMLHAIFGKLEFVGIKTMFPAKDI